MTGGNELSRRKFLELAAAAGATLSAGCGTSPPDGRDRLDAGGDGIDGGNAAAAAQVGVASYAAPAMRRASVRRAVELAGGLPWIRPGDRVLIKPAHNSPNPYPFTASPEACGELANLCLEAGAGKVIIADVMGVEHTLIPGGWGLESQYGPLLPFSADSDATIRAFRNSGLWAGVEAAVGASNVGPDRDVHITSWREHNWRRWESAADTPGGEANARLGASWLRDQVHNGTDMNGETAWRPYVPRNFDRLREEVPGMWFPNLLDEVDHVINLCRVSSHIWSHFTMSLKNWIGIMRPDDRLWMHQLNYLRNDRAAAGDSFGTEPPYHEMLAELHLATHERERLIVADATDVIVSGGPDSTPEATYPARLVFAANDLVAADVTALAVLRMGVLAAVLEGGLGGECSAQPSSTSQLALDFLLEKLSLSDDGLMRGTDVKLCDPTLSNWDWLAIRRTRELGVGVASPEMVDIHFAEDADHAVPAAHRSWISADALRPPTLSL